MIRFTCPACGQKLRAEARQAGGDALCPRCRMTVVVPVPSEHAPPTEPAPPASPPRELVPTALPQAAAAPTAADFDEDEDESSGSFSRPLEKIDPEELIDMTAMVDIVFFLLIFFLVTSFAAVYSSAPLPAPESDEQGAASLALDQEEPEGDVVTVRIDRTDAVWIDDVPLEDPGDLDFRLREAVLAGRGAEGLLLTAHGDATHGTAVAILDAARDAGLERLRMTVTDEEE